MAKELFDGEIIAVKRREQLGIFLLDGSGSMDEIGENNCSLAENVNRTFKDFICFFKDSSIKEEFQIAVINFDYEATVKVPRTPLVDFDDFGNFNPRDQAKDNPGTDIGEGLRKAKEIINDYFNEPNPDQYPRTVTIATLSDGMCQRPESTIEIAKELNADPRITISCCLFTTPKREKESLNKDVKNFLQDIKSQEGIYTVVKDNAVLRKFFNASMSSIKKQG